MDRYDDGVMYRRAIGRARLTISTAVVYSLLTIGCKTISATSYPFLAVTNNCNCEEFRTNDGNLDYLLRAHYRMNDGIVTNIEIELTNRSQDTLSLSVASVKVTSRNISYRYNDKFIPLPALEILPHSTDIVKLTGKELAGEDDWHKIAGERMTVTVKGLTLGGRELKQQLVEFMPLNPKMRRSE